MAVFGISDFTVGLFLPELLDLTGAADLNGVQPRKLLPDNIEELVVLSENLRRLDNIVVVFPDEALVVDTAVRDRLFR